MQCIEFGRCVYGQRDFRTSLNDLNISILYQQHSRDIYPLIRYNGVFNYSARAVIHKWLATEMLAAYLNMFSGQFPSYNWLQSALDT